MSRIKHPEWIASGTSTNYPFASTATMVNNNGITIPQNLFADASLYPVGAGSRLYLSRVSITNQRATLWIGDESTALLASTQFNLVSPPSTLRLVDAYDRPAGLFVSEPTRLVGLQSWSVGTHNFTLVQSEFVTTVSAAVPSVGVQGFVLDDGSLHTGDAWIIGDDGVVVSGEDMTIDVQNEDGSSQQEVVRVLRVDIVGDPLFRRRLCDDNATNRRFVQSVTIRKNNKSFTCLPDQLGDIKLIAGNYAADDTVLRVRGGEGKLVIEAVGDEPFFGNDPVG